MLSRRLFCSALATLGLALGGTSLQAADAPADIVTTAVNAGSFKTLAAALQAAGLVETLQGPGPFTVFAPTDEAFAKLPAGTVETLLKPENKGQLVSILTYHVVPGNVPASEVVKLSNATTVNGQRVAVAVEGSSVKVDQAQVVTTDIACTNGTIHVIDQVILPVSDDIPTVAEKAGSFKTLLAAAQAAGLGEVLASDGPLTVFAPTDEAFAKLPAGTVDSLLKPENRDKLVSILKYHVVPGRIYADQVITKAPLPTAQGSDLPVALKDGKVTVGGAGVAAADIEARNGVIHVIDSVILPPAPVKAAAQSVHQAPVTRLVTETYRCPKSGRLMHRTVCVSQ